MLSSIYVGVLSTNKDFMQSISWITIASPHAFKSHRSVQRQPSFVTQTNGVAPALSLHQFKTHSQTSSLFPPRCVQMTPSRDKCGVMQWFMSKFMSQTMLDKGQSFIIAFCTLPSISVNDQLAVCELSYVWFCFPFAPTSIYTSDCARGQWTWLCQISILEQISCNFGGSNTEHARRCGH